MNNWLKNICLITFALICPITLPAGGIQKKLTQYKFTNNTNDILLVSETFLYSYPGINSKKLMVLDSGTSITILRKWKQSERGMWVRVELATNKILDQPNKIKKGWIKM